MSWEAETAKSSCQLLGLPPSCKGSLPSHPHSHPGLSNHGTPSFCHQDPRFRSSGFSVLGLGLNSLPTHFLLPKRLSAQDIVSPCGGLDHLPASLLPSPLSARYPSPQITPLPVGPADYQLFLPVVAQDTHSLIKPLGTCLASIVEKLKNEAST